MPGTRHHRRAILLSTYAQAHSESKSTMSDDIRNLLDRVERPLTIRDIRVTPITYQPADGSPIHECGPVILSKRDESIVEIWTEEGLKGIGPGAASDAQHSYDHLVGKNPYDLLGTEILPGIDVACWDLVGRALGQPVYRLLALDIEPDPSVHVYASGGVMWTYYDRGDGSSWGAQALIEEALRYKELGFDTFKWRPGTDWQEAGINPHKLGEICRQLREAVGPSFRLGLEKKATIHGPLKSVTIAPIIDELAFYFFEQPWETKAPPSLPTIEPSKNACRALCCGAASAFARMKRPNPGYAKAFTTPCSPIAYTWA